MPPPGDQLSKFHDNIQQQQQQQRRLQYVEALAEAAAAAAVAAESSISHDACRSPSSREEAPYVREHAHKVNETRTQQKQERHNGYWQQQQTGPTAVAAAASTQQRRRRGSGGGQLRASEPPIVRLMTPCLGGCALTYASARGVHTHKLNESIKFSAHSRSNNSTKVIRSISRQAQQQ